MKADRKTKEAVEATLDRFANAVTEHNMDEMMSVLAPDPDLVIIPALSDKNIKGRTELKERAKNEWFIPENTRFEFGSKTISVQGPVAWVTADSVSKVNTEGKEVRYPSRATVVLENRDENWYIVHMHGSVPGSNDFYPDEEEK